MMPARKLSASRRNNGAAGVVITVNGRPVSVMGFTVTGGKIVAIDAVVDPVRLTQRGLSVLDE